MILLLFKEGRLLYLCGYVTIRITPGKYVAANRVVILLYGVHVWGQVRLTGFFLTLTQRPGLTGLLGDLGLGMGLMYGEVDEVDISSALEN